MTDNTQPEALRLADMLTADEWPGHVTLVSYARECVAELRSQHARIAELEAQLESIGAGGVSGPLMGQPQAMPDLSALTERGAKAWAGVDAQGLRDGVASAGSEPVAWLVCTEEGDPDMVFLSRHEAQQYLEDDERPTPLYTHPSPPEGMVGGWISVDKRLPEPNVGVLCAGQGWGNPFVTACYYDDERREWYPINTHWNDSPGSAQYPTHWMPLPPPPTSSADSRKGE